MNKQEIGNIPEVSTDIVIVGAGPAGLAAAIELRRLGAGRVLVVDREKEAGGIPRHCHHTGFGIRDMHRFLSGPSYAARYVRLAEQQGVEIQTETTITGWHGATHLAATSPTGLSTIRARAVILATGCRERPRAARLVPGSRPAGVLTTGTLQNSVYLHEHSVGKKAVIVGADHVSFSAVMTLKHAGADVAALVTDLPRHQSFWQYKLISADRYRVPLLSNYKVSRIMGRRRVEAIELINVVDNSVRQIECDTVVFTGDWIPDYELAFYGGLKLDQKSRSPQVTQRLQTTVKGVFAAGNVIHASETADVAAMSGRYVAQCVSDYLHTDKWTVNRALPIEFDGPIHWVSPSMITPGEISVPHKHFSMRVSRPLTRPVLTIRQGEQILARQQYGDLLPNLPVYASASWLTLLKDANGPIRFELR